MEIKITITDTVTPAKPDVLISGRSGYAQEVSSIVEGAAPSGHGSSAGVSAGAAPGLPDHISGVPATEEVAVQSQIGVSADINAGSAPSALAAGMGTAPIPFVTAIDTNTTLSSVSEQSAGAAPE